MDTTQAAGDGDEVLKDLSFRASSMRAASDTTSTRNNTSSHSSDDKPAFMPTSPVLRAPKGVSETDQRVARVCKLDDKLVGNKNIESLTINKLRFDSLGMVGRETECEELHSCFNRMVHRNETAGDAEEKCMKELVFLRGLSGSGKSKVARSMYNFLAKQRTNASSTMISPNCILGGGKFDYNDSDQAFSAVVRAFDGLLEAIRIHEETSLRNTGEDESNEKVAPLGEMLVDELGSATKILVRLMPELTDLLPETFRNLMGTSSDDEQKHDTNGESGKMRLLYAFRVLTRVLCERFNNIVLILDDLQWADVASLEIMDSLISDVQNRKGLMIIGCYRFDEVDESHILHQSIQSLHDKKEKQNFEITNIDLPAFSLDNVNEVLTRLMSMDEKDVTQPLAQLCLKRTMGNPHFVIQFLTMLTEENLLVFNLGLFRWTWDENKIEEVTMSTENVVQLLQSRMEKLPSNEQLLLQYAACLGNSFQIDTLKLAWMNHKEKRIQDVPTKGLEELIEGLQHGNFIEADGDSRKHYRWVHDSVQEAALSLGRGRKELQMFQFEIGMILYKELDRQELEKSIFDVADLINRAKAKRRVDLATLNLEAAQKAREISAFSSALKYASHGIALLPVAKWAPEYRALTLRLHVLGTQMAFVAGNFAKLDQYGEEVLSQSGCTLLEKIPVHIAQLDKLVATMKYDEGVRISMKLLKELGCNLVPVRALVAIQAVTSLKRTARLVKRISPKQFCEQQPLMEDPHQTAIMLVMSKLLGASFYNGDVFIPVLCALKGVQMTLKHGIHDSSATWFAEVGSFAKTLFADFDGAFLCTEIAELLQQRVHNEFYNTITVYFANTLIHPWKRPVQSCIAPMLENYTRALRSGNNEGAINSLIQYHFSMPFLVGKPLGPILARLPEMLNQTEEMNLNKHSIVIRMVWQWLHKLSGKSSEPLNLKGEIFDCDDETMRDFTVSTIANYCKMVLHLIYGDHVGAAEIALKQGENYGKATNAEAAWIGETFSRAVSCYAAFHKTKLRKYKREAKRVRGNINGWKKKNVPDVYQHVVFLDAEQAGVEKRCADAERLYKESITMAARPGHLHHAALCSEMYCEFLKRNSHQIVAAEEEIRFRVGEAIRYYTEWGALLKVEMMKKDWAEYYD